MNGLTDTQLDQHGALGSLMDEYSTAAPERQQQIYEELVRNRTEEAEDARRARITGAEKYFGDLGTLGGNWTSAQQRLYEGLTSDMEAEKAAFANTHYLAAESGHPLDQVAKVYPEMRDEFAQREFGARKVTDKQLFSLIQGGINQRKQRVQELSRIAGLVEEAAFDDALRGNPDNWATAFGKIDLSGMQQVDSEAAWRTAREVYTRAKRIADDNRDLMYVARDVLARNAGRTDVDSGYLRTSEDPIGDAAKRLAEATPDERRAVYGMLALWAARNGEEKKFFPQLAESFGRTVGAMAHGTASMASDDTLLRYRNELLGDAALVEAGKPASLNTLSTALRDSQNVGSFGTGFPLPNRLPQMRELEGDEQLQLLGEVDRALRINQVTRELRHYGETAVDPIRDVLPKDAPWLLHRLERGAYSASGSIPYMAASMIPYVGLGLTSLGIAGQEYSRLRVEFPAMPAEDAMTIAAISGPIQGAIERLQAGQAFGRLPALGKVMRNLSTPTSSFWRRFAPSLAGDILKQNAEEFAQDITTPVVQNMVAALNEDVPTVDWNSQLGGFEGRVETFISLLPFAFVGSGVQSIRENAIVRQSFHDPELLAFTGISADKAAEIAEAARTDEAAAEALFREAWKARTKEDISRGAALLDSRAAQAEAIQRSPETPTVRPTANGQFEVISPNGAETATFDTEEAALSAVADHIRSNIEQNDRGVSQMIAFLSERDPARQFEVLDQSKTLRDEFDAIEDPEERARILPKMLERMRIAGITFDAANPVASLGNAWILGENEALVRDSAFQTVSRLYQGANWATVVEETAEGFTKEALHAGRVDRPTLERWLRGVQDQLGTPFIAGEKATEQELIEGMSRTATAYMAGRLRKEGLATGLRSVLQQFVAFFRDAFRLAGGMLRLKAQGKLDADFESFLAESVGLDLDQEYNRAADDLAGELIGQQNAVQPLQRSETEEPSLVSLAAPQQTVGGSVEEIKALTKSYAIAPAVYMEQLATRMDNAARSPEERLQVWERAKEKLATLRGSDLFNQEPEAAKTLDYAGAERAVGEEALKARLAELDQQEKEELGKASHDNLAKFMDRIEAAKTDVTRKALEREAKARAAEKAKGIKALFAEKRRAARAEIRAETQSGLWEIRNDERRAAQEAKTREARSRVLQAFATLDAITGAMPTEIRGTVGGSAYAKLSGLTTAKARTDFIESRIEMLDTALERLLRDGYRERIDDLLKKSQPKQAENRVQKSSLGPEAQALAQKAYAASLLDEDQTTQELAKLEGAMMAAGNAEQGDPAHDRAAQLSQLSEDWGIVNLFGAIGKRTAAELATAWQWLQERTKAGRSSWRIQEEARLESQRADKATIIDTFGARSRSGLKQKRMEKPGLADGLDGYAMDLYALHQFMRDILPGKGGPLAERLIRGVRKATGAYESDMLKLIQRFRSAVADAAGLETTKGVKAYLQMGEALARLNEVLPDKVDLREGMEFKRTTLPIELAEKYVRGEATGHGFTLEQLEQIRAALAAIPSDSRKKNVSVDLQVNGGELVKTPLSRWEAMQYRLAWNQPGVRERMERQGFSQAAMRQIDALLSDAFSRKMLAFLEREYGGEYALLNPVYRRLHGMNMPRLERYAPTAYEVGPISETGDLSMFGANPVAAGMSAGFTKTRSSHNELMAQQSAIRVFWRHKTNATYWRHFAELTRELRGIFSDPKVFGALQQAHGDAKAQKLKTWLDRLATNGGAAASGMEWIDGFLNKALSGKSAAVLGFSISSVMKQVDSSLRYWMVLSPGEALRGTRDLMLGRLNQTVAAAWNSPSIQRRVEAGMSPEIRLSMAEESMKPSILLWLKEKSFLPMQYMDAALTSVSSAIVYDAAYRKALATGMSETLAADAAADVMDQAIFEASQPASVANRSLAETSGNAWLRALTLFGSDSRLKIAQEYEIWKGWAAGRIDAKTAATRLFMLHLFGLLTQFAADLFRDVFTGDDDEEIYKAGNYARAFGLGSINGAYVIGQGLQYLGQRLAGGYAHNGSENPVMGSAEEVLKLLNNPGKLIDFDNPTEVAKAWRDALRAIAPFSGTAAGIAPVANVLKDAVGAAENLSTSEK